MTKIGIIGVGHVGSHVAYSLLHMGLCDELVLIDKDYKKLKAHAFDLEDGTTFYPHNVKIKFNDYSELKDADYVVVSVAGEIVAHERMKELETSVECIDQFIPDLKKSGFKGTILSITNPCDIIAYYINKKTGLNVIGSGTTLDSTRLRVNIGKRLGVDSRSVNAFILGEHGDSQFPCYSNVTIGGIKLNKYVDDNFPYDEVTNEVRFRATPIFEGKRNTEFAIGVCAAEIIKAMINDSNIVLPVSSKMNEYGISDIYMSLPCIVGRGGIKKKINLDLSKEELEELQNSSKIISENIKRIKNI